MAGNPFARWFGGSRKRDEWPAVEAWAAAQGHRFARSRDGSGFIIDSGAVAAARPAWRLEWGTSQRHYFSGPELRLRAELGATGELQMLTISRDLMALLEQQVFEESIDGTETRMDDTLPEEMRWLVIYPKVSRANLGTLSERFAALSNFAHAAQSWLDTALAKQLNALESWLPEPVPLLLVVQRGRLTLRCALATPALPALQSALDLFAAALTAARRVGDELAAGRFASERPATWSATAALPPDERAPR